ncbi:NADPH-dependent FMN reductase [Mycetocola reblochoni]|uniref:NADPH:quinone oxidoreductase n=2 Tax=Mycetocola reblochoni TaxID=331618 RepID=A0A1R4JXT1_9MICO|nr:NAD(P)H-dependent oxidoreductase [Mycetocola reblochoni]RLP70579.1 NAD(P)H-dependent oxidoreductase [Mycetocola reblochoni]SJN36900.1 NADPH:quinone oxidoreductase [Mycetocola reblochoni REB411]
MTTTIAVLVGSLRSGASNRALAEAAVALAPEGTELRIVDGLGDVPFYNEDVDQPGTVPATAQALRDAVGAADAVLVATPEHNGTIPAVLKNAIDWLSRPFGAGAVSGLPTAVIGGAHGQYGGVWAQDEARKALGIAGAAVIADATLSVANSSGRFAEAAPLEDPEITAALTSVLGALADAARTAA